MIKDLPTHISDTLVYPVRQSHLYVGSRLTHFSLEGHGSVDDSHSSISETHTSHDMRAYYDRTWLVPHVPRARRKLALDTNVRRSNDDQRH